ncbi:MAG: hypothetical protein Q4P05_02575 [Actinomycetaceae bacterium]|nr:hypothetical protein [Actinomycetaceae bacterium]
MTPTSDSRRKGWRSVVRAMRERLPVNKFASHTKSGRTMPQIENPLIIGGLGVIAVGGSAAMRHLRPLDKRRRNERLLEILETKLSSLPGDVTVDVDTREAFGKPALIQVTVTVAQQPAAPHDLLDRVLKTVWDYGQPAPVGAMVTLRVIANTGSDNGESADDSPTWTLDALGYIDGVARPHDIFDRFGAPASDPGWKP